MIPTLYEAGTTTYTTNGIGRLSDAVSCIVTEERNGSYELVMTYPITGIHYNDLTLGRIIYAAVPMDCTAAVPDLQDQQTNQRNCDSQRRAYQLYATRHRGQAFYS